MTVCVQQVERLIRDMEAKRDPAENPSPLRLMILSKIIAMLKAERDWLHQEQRA